MTHTSIQQFIDAIIHGPSQAIRQLSKEDRPVLSHDRGVSVSNMFFWSDDSVEVAEADVSLDAAGAIAANGADTVVAGEGVGVVEEGVDVRTNVNVSVIGGETVGVVGVAAEAHRLGAVGNLVVVPKVICDEGDLFLVIFLLFAWCCMYR